MQASHLKRVGLWKESSDYEGTLLARIDRGATMDPVTSPLIHKDSGRRARVDPGEENPRANENSTLTSVKKRSDDCRVSAVNPETRCEELAGLYQPAGPK